MLLKASSSDKNSSFLSNNGKGKGKARSISSRIHHRKTLRVASKPTGSSTGGKRVPIGKRISLGKNQKNIFATFPPTTSSSSLCDNSNSNDSGLGFDHHESQNILHQQAITGAGGNSSQILTLASGGNNANYNGGVNYQQRSLNTIRYGEITQSAYMSSSSARMHGRKQQQQTGLGAGKKIRGIVSSKSMLASKCASSSSNHMTLRNETEDTCGDDFFSTHIQKNGGSNKTTNRIASPSKSAAESSSPSSSSSLSSSSPPNKGSSSSSSPLSSTSDRSSPEVLLNDETKLLHVTMPSDSLDAGLLLSPSASASLSSSSAISSLQNQNLTAASRNGSVQLQIVTQPEQQHRARYQTEGSRGAVKDKSGNGFPVVKLNGYNKTATLQVFIGNDVGRVSPHIFYQACKVSGKNSTPCNEVKIEGTMIIEIEMKPENDMTVVCDCVGILKERNVDVEHRLGKNHTLAAVTRNKKKSTKCRMIFRATINEDDGEFPEILQICSNTITCTQPPGVPEICKKSLDTCSALGGKELFIIGKNFLKDTKVTFARFDELKQTKKLWEETVQPDKEYLQQTHLICTVPAFPNADEITEPVQVQIYVTSSNKRSEPHNFVYLPLKHYRSIPPTPSTSIDLSSIVFSAGKLNTPDSSALWSDGARGTPENIMAPPLSRQPSFSKNLSDPSDSAPITLKTEYIEQNHCNGGDLQESSTSLASPPTVVTSSIRPSSPSSSSAAAPSPTSVKEIIYNDSSALIAVAANGQCFVAQSSAAAAAAVGGIVPSALNEFLQPDHIKSEQNTDIQSGATVASSSASTAMLPPLAPPPSVQQHQPEMNAVQQQQAVENFLNMICAQAVDAQPNIVPQAPDIHPHLHHELVLSSNPTAVVVNSNIQSEHAANMCAIATQSPMMCEQNLLQLSDTNIIPMSTLESTIEAATTSAVENTSLISNAVSDATAETQAVVKQMIATVTAELLSENPVETQSTITNFISSTLVNDMVQAVSTEQAQQGQPQISDSQQQQLQEIIAQELLTPVMIKKEDNNNGQTSSVEDNIINVATTANPSTNNLTQPFSPTPADFNLTTMSESDLISFINPSVFM